MGAAFLVNFLRFLLIGLWLVILARVILSWVDPAGRSRFATFIFQTSEPILAPDPTGAAAHRHVRPLAAARAARARRPDAVRRLTARIAVRLVPRGGADRIEGVIDGVLRVRVAAAPVDGAANASLERLIADALGLPRGRVRLVAGATNRHKLIEIEGLEPAAVRARWPGLDV